MYVPRFNVMNEAEVRGFVEGIGSAELVTVGGDGTPPCHAPADPLVE